MPDNDAPKPPPKSDSDSRESRLAAALRANLRRRKAPAAAGKRQTDD